MHICTHTGQPASRCLAFEERDEHLCAVKPWPFGHVPRLARLLLAGVILPCRLASQLVLKGLALKMHLGFGHRPLDQNLTRATPLLALPRLRAHNLTGCRAQPAAAKPAIFLLDPLRLASDAAHLSSHEGEGGRAAGLAFAVTRTQFSKEAASRRDTLY